MPLDTTVRHAAAQKVLEDAQVYRTDAGEKQVAADRAARALPYANQASTAASAADALLKGAEAAAAQLAPGQDPEKILALCLSFADEYTKAAQGYLRQAADAVAK